MTEYRNPYVGPSAFTEAEADRFFGREREARDLKSMLIAHRLVLFYAQSGAGKSSLINARLIPSLRDDGFEVLPVGRVGGEVVNDVDNPFTHNLMLTLDKGQHSPEYFVNMTLAHFLAGFRSLNPTFVFTEPDEANDLENVPRSLIIDQFEEIFTTNLHAWAKREGFFRQLAEAMRNEPRLWVLLAMREDYVAALDPYAHLLPGNLRARFYIQPMRSEAALEAIVKPAQQFGRPFSEGAASYLVDDLRKTRAYGQAEFQLGQFVEPVQLQVVCQELWDSLEAESPGQAITVEDIHRLGDVDLALVQFYERAVAEVTQETEVTEMALRQWFERRLITEARTRGLVFRGAVDTGGLPNPAVHRLADRFLLRADTRPAGTWYELVNDRFIEPILQANQAWLARQPVVVRMAQTWEASGRPESQLLSGPQLEAALARHSLQDIEPVVHEFLKASQDAQAYSKARFRWLKALVVILAITNIVTLLFAIWAILRTP